MSLKNFASPYVSIDLEIHPESNRILKIGGFNPMTGTSLSVQGRFSLSAALERLDDFCRGAQFLLGHNLSKHDLPYLKEHHPRLSLHELPLIDTLFLSPLAFPKNPYHRLIKDYKLVKQAVNNPVEDARCTIVLFEDQWNAFKNMERRLVCVYGALLVLSYPHDAYEAFFHALTGCSLPNRQELRAAWLGLIQDKVCHSRMAEVVDEALRNPPSAVCLAYILAWVRIAGENSVLPSWVRYQFPQIPALIDRLRGKPCLQYACRYCREHHDPITNLERFFGYSSFRALHNEIPPLQQQVVNDIVRGNHCLAVLPTGYGKSVCYQLPSLMKARQRNQLSLIISPLQSLMKDQVDGLKHKGVLNVGTINGMLTMLERTQMLEDVRLGKIDLLWLAPEQLRNASVKSIIKQREIGMVVVDEAHCFSKWGHDFRPDYLYIVTFLKELCSDRLTPLPQVACFTATAKKDVIEEIRAYFKEKLDIEFSLFDGGHERSNLRYFAENVRESEKEEVIHERLTQIFGETGGDGGGIVFAATRSRVEKFSKVLDERGWLVDFFHGGRTPEDKKQAQERFLQGELQVIVATNAFGMGIDKPDVRVVIHADVPGSLENYLQEAGRAGRDGKSACCFLLFHDEDLETQFTLSSYSRLEWRDMSGMLTGLKHLAVRDPGGTVVLTSGELLRSDSISAQHLENLSVDESMYDTKVKTALAWLEKSGKVVRGDNRTHVIQGKVLVENVQQARQKVGALKLSQHEKQRWLTILEALLQSNPNELLNTDQLSLATGLEPQELLSVMRAMRDAGIINHDLNMTAYVYHKIANDSAKRFQRYVSLEKSLLNILQELEPDIGPDKPCLINLRSVSQALKDAGEAGARPDRILLALDLMVQQNLLRQIYPIGDGVYKLYFRQDWPTIRQTLETTSAVCSVILATLLAKLPAARRGKDLLVSFRSGELYDALQKDITTRVLNDLEKRIHRGLLSLHNIRAICLQSGLTVFRPAMTITVTAEKTERFTQQDYRPLGEFYREKNIQVHVIGRYAELAVENIKQAVTFIAHYFGLDRFAFLRLYFKEHKEFLDLPTTPKTYERIVTQLNNAFQESVVTAPLNKNLLIVAGPGSGKTRTLVHRIAYLIRVKRVPPRQILAIAFNRSAVTQLKLRLKELIGKDASWVRVRTYYSLAMSITGRSFRGKAAEKSDSSFFRDILKEAVEVLEQEAAGDHGALGWRDTLLSGLRFILVDEYQDIDELEYRFLSFLAGRNEQESGRQPVLLAVGDDDQNIYAWKGSHVRFIRSFQEEYQADLLEMSANYRSTNSIIEVSNALISKNSERMKSRPIVSAERNPRRASQEKVIFFSAPERLSLFKAVLQEAHGLTEGQFKPADICILCRTHKELYHLQILARHLKIRVHVMRARKIPLTRTREFQSIINALNNSAKELINAKALASRIDALIAAYKFSGKNIWVEAFRAILQNYCGEILDARLPVGNFLDYVYDVSRDTKQSQQLGGDKIILSTMHTAKGMEFPVVFVAGQPLASESPEDERRLYYVAMTRAMDRLYCGHHEQSAHPFLSDIAACAQEYVIKQERRPAIHADDWHVYRTLLWELDLSDVSISFPAYRKNAQASQRLLSGLEPGASRGLVLKKSESGCTIFHERYPIARLSSKGAKQYATQIAHGYQVEKIIFLASIRWNGSEEAEEFASRRDIDTWYSGLFQIVFAKDRLPPT